MQKIAQSVFDRIRELNAKRLVSWDQLQKDRAVTRVKDIEATLDPQCPSGVVEPPETSIGGVDYEDKTSWRF